MDLGHTSKFRVYNSVNTRVEKVNRSIFSKSLSSPLHVFPVIRHRYKSLFFIAKPTITNNFSVKSQVQSCT